MPPTSKVDLEVALASVTTRLVRRFDHQVERSVVEATVRRCADGFANARVRNFVPLFVERQSVERLAAMTT